MSFIIEFIFTHILEIFIAKKLKWNEEKYNEIIHNKNEFVFNKHNKWYLFFKLNILVFLIISIIIFFYLYFYGLYHNNQHLVIYVHHKPYVKSYHNTLLKSSWTFLLFGFLYLLDLMDIFNPFIKHHLTKMQKLNLLYSCQIPYYLILIIINMIRIILLFSVDGAINILYYHTNALILKQYHDSTTLILVFNISYIICLISCLMLIVNSILVLITHTHLKVQYFFECIELNKYWIWILKHNKYYQQYLKIKMTK